MSNTPSTAHVVSPHVRRPGFAALALLLGVLALVFAVAGLVVGSTGLGELAPGARLFDALWAWQDDPVALQIVWDIRLPRTLGAWAAGALLALAGAVAQGLFRNPLADPYLLGSASGASLGVAVALALLGVSPLATQWLVQWGLTGAAFCGAVLAVLLTLALAGGVRHTLRLLLCGVVVGVVLGALSSLLMLAVPQVQQTMQAFLLGSTAFVGWSACVLMFWVWCVCMAVAWWLSPVLDGLSLGEATAHTLGLPVVQTRVALVAVIALATGAAVAQTGLIAFVGLAAPHLVRAMVTLTHARMLCLSSAMGGVLLMGADLLARTLIAPQELPVGVLTAVLGGGYLLWLMRRSDAAWGGRMP